MTENKRYKYYDEENGEFPFPSIKTDDRRTIVTLYECCALLNEQDIEIQRLKTMNNELIKVIQGISKDSAETIIKLWTGEKE